MCCCGAMRIKRLARAVLDFIASWFTLSYTPSLLICLSFNSWVFPLCLCSICLRLHSRHLIASHQIEFRLTLISGNPSHRAALNVPAVGAGVFGYLLYFFKGFRSDSVGYFSCVCENWSARKKPTHALGGHANSTQKGTLGRTQDLLAFWGNSANHYITITALLANSWMIKRLSVRNKSSS